MAARRPVQKATGLFQNGALWWMWVKNPQTKERKRLSTGMADLRDANSVAAMVEELAIDRTNGWPWISRVVAKEATLLDVYNYRVRNALHELRDLIEGKTADAKDEDLRDYAKRWIEDVLPKRVTKRGRGLDERQQADYARQLRFLIPADQPTKCSEMTEEFLSAALSRLGGKASTSRNYAFVWRMFVRWARRKGAPITGDPFEYAEEFVPRASKPRMKVWSHSERLAVLGAMNDGTAQAAVAIMLGSGMELSALLRLRGRDVSHDGTRTAFADGTKTEYRSRHVTVDEWAWAIFVANAPRSVGNAKVFPWSEASKGNALRDSFYRAQVRAGFCEKPPKSKREDLWGQVDTHTLHDCRHTYAICRSLGLDGETKQDNTYISNQHGHVDEVLTKRIYKAVTPARRRQLLAEAEKLRASSKSA